MRDVINNHEERLSAVEQNYSDLSASLEKDRMERQTKDAEMQKQLLEVQTTVLSQGNESRSMMQKLLDHNMAKDKTEYENEIYLKRQQEKRLEYRQKELWKNIGKVTGWAVGGSSFLYLVYEFLTRM
ncbi:hypothetical protein EV213_12287 [Aureibacillus halotolerans]|uniref:Uncharacterized protein n=2 Tax=Aureibacillus halotolerans TaxID=1508390 RepID=A0A4R6TV38_9BACI|nr:hypothetical protein EV213_12287 [Aureibacillus halotolerans]